MEFSIHKQERYTLVALAGERFGGAISEFPDELMAVADGRHARIIIDCTKLPMPDSTLIGIIVAAAHRCQSNGGSVALINIHATIQSLLGRIKSSPLRFAGSLAEAEAALA